MRRHIQTEWDHIADPSVPVDRIYCPGIIGAQLHVLSLVFPAGPYRVEAAAVTQSAAAGVTVGILLIIPIVLGLLLQCCSHSRHGGVTGGGGNAFTKARAVISITALHPRFRIPRTQQLL